MSNTSSLYCSHMNAAGLFLTIACTLQYSINNTRALLLSVDRQLTLSHLPEGYTRYDQEIFLTESVAFQRTKLPLSVDKTTIITTDYAFNTMDDSPTVQPTIITTGKPSVQPSKVPSSQPSSSPTAAPSVSPQPTCHPSSGRPTNTYKPTVKPTQHPSIAPSQTPAVLPTTAPSTAPTARPSIPPSRHPSAQPSVSPTPNPTHAPQCKPTRKPSSAPSVTQTHSPSLVNVTIINASTNKNQRSSESALFILLYVLGGLAGLWCIHRVFQCYLNTAAEYTRKRKLRAHRNATILSLTPCLSQEKNTNAPKNDSNTGANIDSIGVPPASDVDFRGAFADGAYANGPGVHTAVLGAVTSDSVKDPVSIKTSKSGGSGSASVVLSSLHSSELSYYDEEVEDEEEEEEEEERNSESSDYYSSVHSREDDVYTPSSILTVTTQSQPQLPPVLEPIRSRESAMEEGSAAISIDHRN